MTYALNEMAAIEFATMTLREAYHAFDRQWVVMDVTDGGSPSDFNRRGVVLYHGKSRRRAESLARAEEEVSGSPDKRREIVVLFGGQILPEGIGLQEAIQALKDGQVVPDPRVLERWL